MEYLSWSFMWFEAILGFTINMKKSKLILVGGDDYVEMLIAFLCWRVGQLPSTYLGSLLGVSFKSARTWNLVEERF